MAASKRLVLVSVLLAGAAVSACTSTGNKASASLSASSDVRYPLLPDAILTIPNAPEADGGSIAEASVVQVAKAEDAPAGAAAAAAPQMAAAPAQAQTGEAMAAPDGTRAMTAAYAGGTPSQALASLGTAPTGPEQIRSIMAPETRIGPPEVGARSPELDLLIAKYAKHYEVPEDLVRHVAKRESTLNPKARNGPYWGLMQISHRTAQGMGYRGTASGLLDAETNLKYAVRYLRGAWLVAKGNMALADRFYRRGYYYDAKRAGLLDETGLGSDRRRRASSL